MKNQTLKKKWRGQAMVEFSLTLPILTLVIFGIIDFGRLLFTYAQASNSLRQATRYAEVIGYADASTKVYLDCAGMREAAGNVYFAHEWDPNSDITIKYIDASDTAVTYDCSTVTDAALENGDILEIQVKAEVKLIAFPLGNIPFDFVGRRTIIKKIEIGGECVGADEYFCDRDYDGLADGWEKAYFGNLSAYNATDDPDGDGCNNGCEELRDPQTDPTSADNTPPPTKDTSKPAPVGFTATANCATGDVNFSWSLPNPPFTTAPTRLEIRRVSPLDATKSLLVEKISNVASTTCTSCDLIETTNGYKEYFMVAIFGTAPSEVEGANSIIDAEGCAKIPPAPVNFSASADCSTGNVDFSWKWGGTALDPLPTRAQIFDSVGNPIAAITNTTQTTCSDCTTITIPNGTKSFYMIAYNGTGSYEKASPATATVAATCPTPNTAKITGTLWQDDYDRVFETGETGFNLKSLQYRSLDIANDPWKSIITDANGVYTTPILTPGNYQLKLPIALKDGPEWTLDIVRGDYSSYMIYDKIAVYVSAGQTVTLHFGYQK